MTHVPRAMTTPLEPAAERELVLAAKDSPDQRAELIAAFGPQIAAVARAHGASEGEARDALVDVGTLGLLRALDRYDPDLGTPFWAYAAWWVRHAIRQHVDERTVGE
jgi:RNA polymerase sigma factor (sigma-70 family)